MIVVEGPDGSGKTTLVNMLKEELGISVVPRVVSQETKAMVNLKEWVDQNLDGGLVPKIFDRHRLISETIYGPILRPESEPGFDELSWLGPRMSRFYHMKPVIIYCLPPLETVLDNLRGDANNIAVIDHMDRIYQGYVSRIALDHSFAPRRPLVWDYTRSMTINNKPTWLGSVLEYTNDLLNQKVAS